jgi:hypothetical protein
VWCPPYPPYPHPTLPTPPPHSFIDERGGADGRTPRLCLHAPVARRDMGANSPNSPDFQLARGVTLGRGRRRRSWLMAHHGGRTMLSHW